MPRKTSPRKGIELVLERKSRHRYRYRGLGPPHGSAPPQWLTSGLSQIDSSLKAFTSDCKNQTGVTAAHNLAPIYRQTLDLYARVQSSDLEPAKAGLELELGEKIEQFQTG